MLTVKKTQRREELKKQVNRKMFWLSICHTTAYNKIDVNLKNEEDCMSVDEWMNQNKI